MADLQEQKRSTMGSIYESKDVRSLSLAATMQERLKDAPRYSRGRCIYRVPNLLRQTNKQSYTPSLVSIGPLHHNDPKLLPMEAHKLKYLQFFLHDAQVNEFNPLNLLIWIVKGKETEIRECYGDPIDLSSDDFTQMVLIDSAFIIQLFRMRIDEIERDAGDYMYNQPFLVPLVWHDILLEENQLPFFILDLLYSAAFQTNATTPNSVLSFTEIACRFLNIDRNVNSIINHPVSYCHLLHLLSFHSRPTGTTKITTDKAESKLSIHDLAIPTATQLREAGVKFLAIKTKCRSNICGSIDIKFDKEKGVLEIPNFCVSDITEYISRNMIAFEQLNYGYGDTRYITDFHFFLDCLINTPEDVKLLVEAGIIHNIMGSHKQVADLINSINTHAYTSPDGLYYEQISLDLIHHCKKRWNRYRAILMHTYFKHPWAAASVVYATVLLLLTIAQLAVGIMAIP